MNVFIISKNGVIDTPILVKNDTTAEAVFESLVSDLLGEDAEYIDLFDDSAINKVNAYLKHANIHIDWFVDIEINNYKN